MKLLSTRLTGPKLLKPMVVGDGRGFFIETYRRTTFGSWAWTLTSSRTTTHVPHADHPGSPLPANPRPAEACARRAGTCLGCRGRHSAQLSDLWTVEAFELDDERNLQLYAPVGFAHGFCALSEVADLVYKVGGYYDPATEHGIAWDDPDLGIPWPAEEPVLSDRDRDNPRLAAIRDCLPDW